MKRELVVVTVIIVAAAVVLVAGLYFLATSFQGPPPPPPPPPSRVQAWNVTLDPGLTYSTPVLGPTTPLDDAIGGLWVINAAREGVIDMNLSRIALGLNGDPFVAAGNASLRLSLASDFAETATPLRAVYYIVPAVDASTNAGLGPSLENGALAFFAGRDVVAADPFNRSVFLRYTLPFTPTWTGEDPASAGDMLIAPSQLAVTVGLVSFPVGPYRYLWASDGNHTVVFEVTYVHAGYCPCAAPTGAAILFANATLSAPPFVYYDQFAVNQSNAYRSGAGAAIVLPLANGTLEILDTGAHVKAWVPLRLGGVPAAAVGRIGFVQVPYPVELLVPVRSASATGLVALSLASLSPAWTFPAGAATWVPVGAPFSSSGAAVYQAWYSPSEDRTHILGANATGAAIPQFNATVPGLVRSVFQVSQVNGVFAATSGGGVVRLNTTFVSAVHVTPTAFPVALPSAAVPVYAGSPGGTRYGTLLSSQEVLGAWTDPSSRTTALFQFVTMVTSAASARPSVAAGGLALLAVSAEVGALTWGRRTSCSARACGPRPSCPRTRA